MTTPPDVVTAIRVVASYLELAKYGSVIIAPGGGASFHLRNILDEKGDLFQEITRLLTELEDTQRALAQALASADAANVAVSRAQRVCFAAQEWKRGLPPAVRAALEQWEQGT